MVAVSPGPKKEKEKSKKKNEDSLHDCDQLLYATFYHRMTSHSGNWKILWQSQSFLSLRQ
jgi:hypothetical protein